MKKNKTPKGLISGELKLDFKDEEYWALVIHYGELVGRGLTLSEHKFIGSLLDTLRAVAENTKKQGG